MAAPLRWGRPVAARGGRSRHEDGVGKLERPSGAYHGRSFRLRERPAPAVCEAGTRREANCTRSPAATPPALLLFPVPCPRRLSAGEGRPASRGLLRTRRVRTDLRRPDSPASAPGSVLPGDRPSGSRF
ncbi:hypothetical protein C3488_12585 [Streptomyces sp. Ru72]|nr:hypothetical protein C3488_12585 [Streptomyces sp. Ru72]